MRRKPEPVASQAIAILDQIADGECLSTARVQREFAVSERVARVVSRVLRGVLDYDVVLAEHEGRIPQGTVSPKRNASANPDVVVEEQAEPKGTHTTLSEGRHLFEWTVGGLRRAVVLSEDELREIIREYVGRAQGGLGKSMQQVAVKHRLTRRDFHKIKTLYGLTKDHEPFTTADMAERDVDDLAEEQLALKRQRLAERVEREDLVQLRRFASKWLALKDRILDPFEAVLERVMGHSPPECHGGHVARREGPSTARTHIVFYQASDLHFGLKVDPKLSLTDQAYDRPTAAARWRQGLREALEHSDRAFGLENLDYVLLGVGGDVAHVDNIHGLTSSMRHHQDLDGLPHTIPQELTEMYLEGIDDLLEQGVNVHCECIPGNHDELISRGLMVALWSAYRTEPRVTFGNFNASHAFHLYGKTLLIGHHGHGEKKAKELAATADVWLRDMDRSARYRYALTGNLHHLDVKEDNGLILLQQPSPAASDVYHALNGYAKARAATIAAFFSPDQGLLDIRYIGW